jgi:histidine triad (HIT) family protein
MSEKEFSEDDLKNMSAEEIAELQKQNCIFCKIANKEIPAKIIHEDATTICILDINPASEGHILVYPKKHYMIMPHIPDDVLAKVFKNVRLMSHTLLKSLQCKGTTIFVANGVAAGQKAPHVLIHVFPRRENDDLVKLPSYEMSDEQIEKLKNELKPYLNHAFDVKQKIVKDAEFVETIKDAETKKDVESRTVAKEHSKIRYAHHEKTNEKSSDESSDEHKEEKIKEEQVRDKKKYEDKKKEPTKKDAKSKVDLDDITKLFGG